MSDQILRQIERAISEIKYGSVEIVIHDSHVVQIEKKEKLRFGADHKNTGADRTSGSSASKEKEGEVK